MAEHRELLRLCRSIVMTQLREIRQMQMWLCRWYGECDLAYLRSASPGYLYEARPSSSSTDAGLSFFVRWGS